MTLYNWVSFFGMFGLIAFAWCFSTDRKIIQWRVIFWAIFIQFFIAFFIFKFPLGIKFFFLVNQAVIKVLESSQAGIKFLFGILALSPGVTNEMGEKSIGFILAFQALPTIIFFSSLVSILYYLRIMPFIIKTFAVIFTKVMKISGAESLAATSNIFVGVESALTIQPYLQRMTASELTVVLTSGMATVASNVLGLYVFTLKDYFPAIAGHLVSASLLSCPAAMLMAKLIVPEKEVPETLGVHIDPVYSKEETLFEAIINGANSGVKMIVGITALLVAILGLVALADLIISFIGLKLNYILGLNFDWSLKNLCGIIFYPFVLLVGVAPEDASLIAKIIGERLILTEVVSYQDLASALSKNMLQDSRSAVIATYALCGFAHVASMAIFVGGTAALAPSRTRDLTRLSFRALLAATLACLMTASIAGIFFTKDSILFQSV